MIESLINHLVNELENSNKKETTYIVLAVVLFIPELIFNSILATDYAGHQYNNLDLALLIISFAASISINVLLIIGIYINDKTRKNINASLSAVYSDNNLDKYIKDSPNGIRKWSNVLPMIIIIVLSVVVILIPIVVEILESGAPAVTGG
jgi:hypothetical protein